MRVCTQCGKESRDDETTCAECGERLAVAESAPVPTASSAPTGWVWPWQRAERGEAQADTHAAASAIALSGAEATVPASAASDLEVRAPVNGAAAHEEPLAAAGGRLLLEAGDSEEPTREFALDGRNVTIGRAPACTVSLPEDQLASRLHAMLHYTGDEYTISDLGSSNGTLVNGTLIRGATALAEGDRITVGQHVLIYTHSAGARGSMPADARGQGREPASAIAPTAALVTLPGDAPFDEARTDEPAGAPSVTQETWASPDAEREPAAAPHLAVASAARDLPSWPPSGADPWVMPAPPQWAAGPAADAWLAPQEPQDAQAPGTETSAAAWPALEGQDPAAASRSDAPPWLAQAAPWNADADDDAGVAPAWLAAALADAPRQPGAYVASPPLSDGAMPPMDQAPATGELDQLRTQLMQSSEQLARWTQSAASHSRQVRTELAALAYEIASLLAETPGADAPADGSLDALVELAESAAQDPHHVNTVVALASRSSDVASVLRAQRRLLVALKRVGDRLAALARQDSW